MLTYDLPFLFQAVQRYSDYGQFPDGKALVEQEDRLWREMNIVQQLISHKKWELNPYRVKRQTMGGYQMLTAVDLPSGDPPPERVLRTEEL